MLNLVFGLCMLIGGMFVMRYGLKKALWKTVQSVLATMTKTSWRGLVFGTIAAAIFQSSTTVCLIIIGLVGAEYITFRQALGVVLGANIGTCSTVQLLNLSISSEFILPWLIAAAMAGFIPQFRNAALTLGGLFCMFLGLNYLIQCIAALSELNHLVMYLSLANGQPMYGIWGGVILTMAFQSSSAATAFVMLLAEQGLVNIHSAAYIVYGNNVGSCISSVIFSAAAPVAARRTAVAHILLNLLGVIVFYPFTDKLVFAAAYLSGDFGGQVAAVHTLFNVLSSFLALGVIQQFSILVELLVPLKKSSM